MMLLVHPETARKICVRAKVGNSRASGKSYFGIGIDYIGRR